MTFPMTLHKKHLTTNQVKSTMVVGLLRIGLLGVGLLGVGFLGVAIISLFFFLLHACLVYFSSLVHVVVLLFPLRIVVENQNLRARLLRHQMTSEDLV